MKKTVVIVVVLISVFMTFLYFPMSRQIGAPKFRLLQSHPTTGKQNLDLGEIFLKNGLGDYYELGREVHAFYIDHLFNVDNSNFLEFKSVFGADKNYEDNAFLHNSQLNSKLFLNRMTIDEIKLVFFKIGNIAYNLRGYAKQYEIKLDDLSYLLLGFAHSVIYLNSVQKQIDSEIQDHYLSKINNDFNFSILTLNELNDPFLVRFLLNHILFNQGNQSCRLGVTILNNLSGRRFFQFKNAYWLGDFSEKGFFNELGKSYLHKCKDLPSDIIHPDMESYVSGKYALSSKVYETYTDDEMIPHYVYASYLESLAKNGLISKYQEVKKRMIYQGHKRQYDIDRNIHNWVNKCISYMLSIKIWFFLLCTSVVFYFIGVYKIYRTGRKLNASINCLKELIQISGKSILKHITGEKTNMWVALSVMMLVLCINFIIQNFNDSATILLNR